MSDNKSKRAAGKNKPAPKAEASPSFAQDFYDALPVTEQRLLDDAVEDAQKLGKRIALAEQDVLTSDGDEHAKHWERLERLRSERAERRDQATFALVSTPDGLRVVPLSQARSEFATAEHAPRWSSWPLPSSRAKDQTHWYKRLCGEVEHILTMTWQPRIIVPPPATARPARPEKIDYDGTPTGRLCVAAVEKALRSSPPGASDLRAVKPSASGSAAYTLRMQTAWRAVDKHLRDATPDPERIIRLVLKEYGYARARELGKLLYRQSARLFAKP